MTRNGQDEYGFLFRVGNSNSPALHVREVVEVNKDEKMIKWRFSKLISKVWEGNRRTMRVSKLWVAKDNAFSAGKKPVEVWLSFDKDEIVHKWDDDKDDAVCAIPEEVVEEALDAVLAAHVQRRQK
ncbi:hypothetical protein CYMTET_23235 [Cymbomonas tetramitiformis]|uniref:Uncharacterized protein n=1 Tax=Cymbomonas tetramitiformis TaxID=36881 RepID=A0AAE0L1E8_9CHLO|nr:hypothetical protein CYMTET_23235 [Cymbomonas tetramitiformis]